MFVKHLRSFGKAGIVKNEKDEKVGDRGKMLLADGHARSCYRMYNPVTSRMCETWDII